VPKKYADALPASRTTRERMRVDLAWFGREVVHEGDFHEDVGRGLLSLVPGELDSHRYLYLLLH
jgi:hypothetical protein